MKKIAVMLAAVAAVAGTFVLSPEVLAQPEQAAELAGVNEAELRAKIDQRLHAMLTSMIARRAGGDSNKARR